MTTLVSGSISICLKDSSDLRVVATLNPATMDALQLFRGDTIIVRWEQYDAFTALYTESIASTVVRRGEIPS